MNTAIIKNAGLFVQKLVFEFTANSGVARVRLIHFAVSIDAFNLKIEMVHIEEFIWNF